MPRATPRREQMPTHCTAATDLGTVQPSGGGNPRRTKKFGSPAHQGRDPRSRVAAAVSPGHPFRCRGWPPRCVGPSARGNEAKEQDSPCTTVPRVKPSLRASAGPFPAFSGAAPPAIAARCTRRIRTPAGEGWPPRVIGRGRLRASMCRRSGMVSSGAGRQDVAQTVRSSAPA